MNQAFTVKQFEDKPLAHYSYAILSGKKVVLVDPQRDPKIYYDFAKRNGAEITGVIETHPHADFASSHLEIHRKTGATLYASKLVEADYPHRSFDEGNKIELDHGVSLRAINTPGHSPDSICIVLNQGGKDRYVFTGDTLFIGDCGRPDLREKAGAMMAKREELAGQMYDSLREKLMTLDDDVVVYPTHGSGSLCGKALSEQDSSTIGAEKMTNWSMQDISKEEFIKEITSDQPFIPGYFGYNVAVNKGGAYDFQKSINEVKFWGSVKNKEDLKQLDPNIIVIDTRSAEDFRQGHLPNSINLMEGNSFETWLGSIVEPDEPYYLAAENQDILEMLVRRTAKIAYEGRIEGAFVLEYGEQTSPAFDKREFEKNKNDWTVLDIRNDSEVEEGLIFENALHIPLNELRKRTEEIPADKPILVHCAGGYRSAAGSSIVEMQMQGKKVKVVDLS
nr:MBL fold metallo-hydrolase [Saprospiraceae bacterium]